MATTATAFADGHGFARDRVSTASVPWSIYAVLFASTSVILGVMWDISWHRTIGRDTFWTPAHMGIYLGGVVAGLTSGWVALRTTFAGSETERGTAVRFWGFRAPLGAWVCIWGAFAMLTSAPFDDWWHNAYGLDVKIISPPHMLLAAGLLLLLAATGATEHTQRWDMHQSHFYQVSAGVFLFFLVSAARASVSRWPATTVAAVYSAFTILMILVLPLFAAQPLLGPIYVAIDRFMPPDFPLLLVVPAIGLDLLMQRAGRINEWALAFVASIVFVVVFALAQYPFADFLMTPAARNRLFGTHWMPYSIPPVVQQRWFRLNPPDDLIVGLPVAIVIGFVSARCALWWGNWMARVQR